MKKSVGYFPKSVYGKQNLFISPKTPVYFGRKWIRYICIGTRRCDVRDKNIFQMAIIMRRSWCGVTWCDVGWCDVAWREWCGSVWYIWLTIARWLVLCYDVRWGRKECRRVVKERVEWWRKECIREEESGGEKKREKVKEGRRGKRRKSKREEGYLFDTSFTEGSPLIFYSF